MSYDQFIQEWNGRHVMAFGGECVAGVAQYESENGYPIVWGDAVTWINNPIMLSRYDWIANNPNDPNQLPNRGDIVVWDANAPYTGGSGHIAFFERQINSQLFMSYGQNSGGNTMHFAEVHWAHVAGWYHFREPVPQAPPTPASYQIIETYSPGKQVKLNKQPTMLWGMNYHFDYMKDHPVEEHSQGEVWTVTNKVHHEDGYDYYRRDGQVDGFNVADCDDYTPPPPPPYVPPAPPLKATPAPTYPLDWEVDSYAEAIDAKFKKNPIGRLKPDTYKIFKEDGLAINLTLDNQAPGVWINTTDNVPPAPPEPTPLPPPLQKIVEVVPKPAPDKPKPRYDWINNHASIRMVTTNSIPVPVHDLEGKFSDTPLPPHWEGEFSMYSNVNGITYYIPDKMRKQGWYYGVPLNMLRVAKAPLDHNNNGRSDIFDFLEDGMQGFIETSSKYLDGIKAAVTTISPKIQPTKQRIGKAVDGFSRKK